MEGTEFQVVQKEELERAWKSSRRERLKAQEDKIWEHFCKEQDVIENLDNPYEFLENFPDTYVTEIKDRRHLKVKQSRSAIDKSDANIADNKVDSTEVDVNHSENIPKIKFDSALQSAGDCIPQTLPADNTTLSPKDKVEVDASETIEEEQPTDNLNEMEPTLEISEPENCELDHDLTVTFAEENCTDSVYHNVPDTEIQVPSYIKPSPRNVDFKSQPSPRDHTVNRSSGVLSSMNMPISPLNRKPSEKIESLSSALKNSVYCAKLKNIRLKIVDTLNTIIESLHSDEYGNYSDKLIKVEKCAKEFCNRFNRVYMYQLQQQLQSIKRNNSLKLPFGKHTQFQSQMIRMESLHQNMLQALQVYHKSFEQTHCVGDSVDQLRKLVQLVRDSMAECAAIDCPSGVAEVRNIHSDTILSSCENVDIALFEHAIKMDQALSHTDTFKGNRRGNLIKQQMERSRSKMKLSASKSGLGPGSRVDSRLSMYSMDTPKINVTPKTKYLRGDPYRSSTSTQIRSSRTTLSQRNFGYKRSTNVKNEQENNTRKLSSKRPLMKDPQRGRPKKRITKEKDIKTMVEQVCASPLHMSKEPSPHISKDPRHQSAIHTPNSVTTAKSVDGAASKITTPRLKKTEETSDEPTFDLQLDDARSTGRRTPGPDDPKTAQNTPRSSNVTSPTKLGNKAHEHVFQVTQQEGANFSEGDTIGSKNERVSGARNAQLVVCISEDSPKYTEPLEHEAQKTTEAAGQRWPDYPEKYRMQLEPDEDLVSRWGQHRTRFLQHMLTSHMYTNSSIRQPWHVVGRISDKIIDDALVKCARELQIQDKVLQLYQAETC